MRPYNSRDSQTPHTFCEVERIQGDSECACNTMKTMRNLLLLAFFSTFCANCQTQSGVLTLSGGAVAPVGDNPGIGRTTSSSDPVSGTEMNSTPRALLTGTVIDAQSQKPVQGATIFHNGVATHTSSDGK